MGHEQRSRHRLPPGTICYLCGREIGTNDVWDRDHVPPQRFYGKSVRRSFQPQLKWLPTHQACNSSYRSDEELFCLSFAVIAADSHTAKSVLADVQRAYRQGHASGLARKVLAQFGKVALPDGSLVYRYDNVRTARIVWKIARGVFALEDGRILPEAAPHRVFGMLGSWRVEEQAAENVPWLRAVLDTEPLGEHGAVLDVKWLGWKDDESVPGMRAHAMVLLFWDRVIASLLFHDPSCACPACAAGDFMV